MSILETNKAQISEPSGEKHMIHIVGNIICITSFFELSEHPKDPTDKTMILANIFLYQQRTVE